MRDSRPTDRIDLSDRRRHLNERLRAEYKAGAKAEWRKRIGRPMTGEELERVLRRYPGRIAPEAVGPGGMSGGRHPASARAGPHSAERQRGKGAGAAPDHAASDTVAMRRAKPIARPTLPLGATALREDSHATDLYSARARA